MTFNPQQDLVKITTELIIFDIYTLFFAQSSLYKGNYQLAIINHYIGENY